MKIILYSLLDTAGRNIAKILNERNIENCKIFELKESIPYITEIPKEILDKKIDIIIVASKHKSESEIPTLCVHSPGNFNEAKLGGKEKTLSIAPALYIKNALIELLKEKERKNLNYDVTLEVTHHGPTLNFPIMFIEVGSSEKQWNDLDACESVANVIENLCKYNPDSEFQIAIGIGGNHYAENFTKKLINEKNLAIGHIMPKYNFNEEMIKQMIEKTYPKPNFVLIDWKGLKGEQKKKLLKVIEEIGIDYKKI